MQSDSYTLNRPTVGKLSRRHSADHSAQTLGTNDYLALVRRRLRRAESKCRGKARLMITVLSDTRKAKYCKAEYTIVRFGPD